uniref:GTPase rho n=1 Tax=Riptortus pedestris TaxID=329032 RepID=R4WP92_RIPPE|nr:GTPase rho [Riptortus pedestris]
MDRKTLTIIGDGFVGKSSIVQCFKKKSVCESYRPTIMDTYSLAVKVRGRTRHLLIWDTSGQEDWAHLRKLAYPEALAIIIVFDISDRNTLDNVFLQWYPEVSDYCPHVPLILVGNKKDLRRGKGDYVEYAEGSAMAKRIGAQEYLECSVKTGDGVEELLQKANVIIFKRCFSVCW